ncbi:hypothetical protein JUN65_01980 [Gluconacetobacter azotocaptans]|uniref:hypothetical protein n=1 Tax=Gluconacetobacter azotocaptans TaxID=142834 RepID=UPI00195E386E|nr:hypothetical protein [Gluconacetobacter azotocaptans]MBM9400362.1 hypothetical protein [Gluconacetobacter azotocaptans]
MQALIPAGPAVPAILPVVLVLVGIIAVLGVLLMFARQQALHEKHVALDLRVTRIESSVASISERFDGLDKTLGVICQDGKHNRELLHIIIRGHMEPDGK